jgi:hypothetical protein
LAELERIQLEPSTAFSAIAVDGASGLVWVGNGFYLQAIDLSAAANDPARVRTFNVCAHDIAVNTRTGLLHAACANDGVVRVVARGGQRAVTHYESLDRRGRCTLVKCRLETGRRNQIRVHLAALGCPLAGDRKYGFRARADEHFARVMLHSWRMRFVHPTTGARLELTAPPPEPELRP